MVELFYYFALMQGLGGFILFQSEDVFKFACIDFSSQHQKRRKALCIQTDLFLFCPKSKGSCPNTGIVWLKCVLDCVSGG